jgi:hypothetical protein
MGDQLVINEFYTFPEEDNSQFQIISILSQEELSIQTYNIIYCLLAGFFFSELLKIRVFRERLLWICMLFYNNLFRENKNQEYDDNSDLEKEENKQKQKQKPEIKYEDKYKDKIALLESFELSKERLDELKFAIIMETTPLGNVILYYDNNREVFTYYSDSSIPYRFLETCARKYVVFHNCKAIFVDMEEEINNAQKKLQDKKEQKKKEEEEKQLRKATDNIPVRKNVFAKLKSYNKDSGLKVAGISGDSKNSGSKNITSENEENMILKEKANRYSCEGKIINFSFLKKVDRKVVDKRYGMSFSEFKRMQSGL